MLIPKAFLLSAVLLVLGCHESGTWADDPGNFQRAWGVEPPSDVEVVHSWYWRSAHFTREEIYYFQLRASASYAESFALENELEPADPSEVGPLAFHRPKPEWFAPRELAAYRIWSSGSSPRRAIILLDRATGDIFIHAAQL